MTDEPFHVAKSPDRESHATLPVIYIPEAARRDLATFSRDELLILDRALSVLLAAAPPNRDAVLAVQDKLVAGVLHRKDIEFVRVVKATPE